MSAHAHIHVLPLSCHSASSKGQRNGVMCLAQPKEMGLPTTAYYSADEIREVRIDMCICMSERAERRAVKLLT